MNEFDLIKRYFQLNQKGEGVILGIGDDAAVLEVPAGFQLVVTTDTLVQDVHFKDSISPADLACKLFTVNASDIAAMGAIAKWITVNLSLPQQSEHWLQQFARQFHKNCTDSRVTWVGGDLTSHHCLVISATLFGWVKTNCAITRAGAKPEDLIYISGTVGDAALALKLLESGKPVPRELADRLNRPRARTELGRNLQGIVSAMIDCSDGLLQDLQHICNESNVSARLDINNSILSSYFKQFYDIEEWRLAITGGDDYELIMTINPDRQAQLESLFEQMNIPLQQVGKILPGPARIELLVNGVMAELPDKIGYQHF